MLQAEGRKKVFEIKEVEPEDMELMLSYVYGTLDAIPEERVQSLFLATDRLEVRCLALGCLPAFLWDCCSALLP